MADRDEPPRRLVRPGFGETLPELLVHRRGVPVRPTLTVAAALAVAIVVVALVLRDPLDGKRQVVYRGDPVFNVLYGPGIHRAKPEPGELVRLQADRGAVHLAVTVRPLRLPAYGGDVSGVLPIVATRRTRGLARRTPGFDQIAEGKARVNKAPGYQVGFDYGDRRRRGYGLDVLVVPPEMPGVRDGLVIGLRQLRGPRRPPEAGRRLTAAMRSAFRSLKFGADREG